MIDQLTFPDGMIATEYWRPYVSHTPMVCVPVPPVVRMPSDEKLTVTGLPKTDVTRLGNTLSLMTAAPEEGVTAEI